MKKCLIICWYGKLPKHFKIFEKTCSYNEDYDYLIFTDQKYNTSYNNIKIYYKTLEEIKELINKKLNIKSKIEKAYKFCDFKPAYGDIFEDYIQNYEYWGYCDVDMFFGKLNEFIKDNEINEYEKINICGHFTLYKNNMKFRKLYKQKGGIYSYKQVYENSENYAFDEYSGMKKIAEHNNIKTLYINNFADIDKKYSRYRCVNHKNYKNQFYTWENGRVFRYYKKNSTVFKEEFMYIHFQKKHPFFQKDAIEENEKLILGSDEIKITNTINYQESFKNNKYKGKIYECFELIIYILKKSILFLKCTKKEKKIWIKQKLS